MLEGAKVEIPERLGELRKEMEYRGIRGTISSQRN